MPPERLRQEWPAPEHKQQTKSGVASSKPLRPRLVGVASGAEMVWEGAEYPVLSPGIYTVRGVGVQGPMWLRSFQRWSVRIEFALVSEPGNVSVFYNLGTDKLAPHVGRQSRYYKNWVLANGEHPRKGQKMSADVFLDGQFLEVEVEFCSRNQAGEQKAEAEIYSRIKRIISVRRA